MQSLIQNTSPRHPPRRNIDPSVEFNRIRQSLSLLESHFHHHPTSASAYATAQKASTSPSLGPAAVRRSSATSLSHSYNDFGSETKVKISDNEVPSPDRSPGTALTSTPGMLGQQSSGGLFVGPTSAASHLISVRITYPDLSIITIIIIIFFLFFDFQLLWICFSFFPLFVHFRALAPSFNQGFS